LVPNQSPQNCILPPLKDRLERSSFFTKIRWFYTSFVAGKLNQKPPQTNEQSYKILFLKTLPPNLPRASRDHSLARSRRKRTLHKTLSPRDRAALQTLKRTIPQKAKHTDIVQQGSEWSVVGFLLTNARRGETLLEEKPNYQ
jgi:Tfp pilus assembly protein PilN